MRWFLPKNEDFNRLFDEAAENIIRGVTAFREMVGDLSDLGTKVEHLKEIEHAGDRLTHETLARLNKTFITPFDREDIHTLISRMDDVLDATHAAAQRILLYRIEVVPPRVIGLADLLVAGTRELQKAVVSLNDRKQHPAALSACVEVNRLENEADRIHREALADLFATSTDAILVMKLKDIYSFLEEATDRCEDVANAVETIIIKSS